MLIIKRMAGLIKELVADMGTLAQKKYYKVSYMVGSTNTNGSRWRWFESVIFLKKEEAERYAEYYMEQQGNPLITYLPNDESTSVRIEEIDSWNVLMELYNKKTGGQLYAKYSAEELG